ncbi:exodeoxyribonuclease VII small subunit [Candidatus Bandiella euplotis]|uniref:Exodeoxyribonuclease 7 small subunit n=1 Tax=Candidatus Bandiella euplotis TaxID=1664265 RepID=A0ABZ0UJ84_9RICK|nr:exodeoxyribonuclease VII small subunit [Candidatus Bandiella woodruffii]WPX96161.1 Exodeoxyribonuclease 7 small subunit [Candidatus Bandiella woodruffii]WPX96683.1 Exodeoxyribonuclease 7 small subunit [Candidatus Bandiella woodruffii]
MTKNVGKLSFEDAMKRLEEIIKNLENGNVALESAIELYEEGIILQEHCESRLNSAKLKIEKIVKNSDGIVTTEKIKE